MAEQLKALVVLTIIGATVFFIARMPALNLGVRPDDFRTRRNTWFALTALAFLSGDLWIYLIGAAVLAVIASRRDSNIIALYVSILFAGPSFERMILGIGPVDTLFSIGHYRMLNLTLLLPLALSLRGMTKPDPRTRVTDIAVAGLFLLISATHVFSDTASGTARVLFYSLVDFVLPYYAASRGIRSKTQLVDVLTMFFVSALLCAAIALFENLKFWLLYEGLRGPYGIPGDPWVYLLRGEGVLRAKGSVGNSIVLGYILMIAVAIGTILIGRIQSKWQLRAAFVLLAGGLAATVSRGPWVGAVAALAVVVFLGHGASRRFVTAIGVGGLLVVVLMLTPWGSKFAQYLPFVGSVETGSIDYRRQLLEVSMEVWKQNPMFGDIHYILNPAMERMRQGQGIIDMVNTYLQVAMPYGLVGLLLFVAIFAGGMWQLNRERRKAGPEEESIGRGLLAAQVGIAVTIFTVSSIGVVAPLYWLFNGIAIAAVKHMNSTDSAPTLASATQSRLRAGGKRARATEGLADTEVPRRGTRR
jgi:O-antigen ligase